MHRILLLIIAGLLFVTSLAADAIISGVVTSQSTGNPISNAAVVLIKGSQQIVAATVTAVDGSYSFTGVNPGQYTVRASASGFQTAIIGAQAKNNQTTTVNFALLSTFGAISGQVTDAISTLPVSGATVRVFANNTLIASATTNGAGNYTIDGLDPTSYVVTASAATYQTGVTGAIVQAAQTSTVNFALQSTPGTISGTVTDAFTGLPVEGVLIQVNNNGIPVYSTETDASGNYTIADVSPGSYVVLAEEEIYQTGIVGAIVRAGQTSTVNFSLELDPEVVSGTVTDANTGLPIGGAAVELNVNGVPVFSTLTDVLGNYLLTGVAPGAYVVHAHAANYQTGVTAVLVQEGEISTVNFALEPSPGTLSGTVTDANTASPIRGAIIEVNLNNNPVYLAVTDASGNYNITGVAPGTYVVNARAATYQIGISNATVLVNQTTTVNFSLQGNASTVQGQITDALTGSPVSGAFVQVFQNGSLIAVVVSDNNGDYVVDILSAGSYSLNVSARDYYSNSANFSVGVGATVTVNLGLLPDSPPRNLEGEVINNRFLLQADRIHHIQWQASQDPTVVSYSVYRNGAFLTAISANSPLMYDDHNRSSKTTDVYSVNSVNASGDVSSSISITLR
jgi:protocatechuate 3,4-dioxygenase beta subunit